MWPPAPAPFRLIVTGLVIGPVCGLVIGLGVGLTCGLGLVGGLLAGGLAGGLVFGCGCAVTGLGGQSPTQLARWRWRQLLSRSAHVVGWARWLFIGGLAFGTLAGIAVGLFVRPGLGAGIALVSWVIIGLLVGLIGGFSQPVSRGSASPLTPLASWRGDRVFGLVIGLVGGLVIGLALGLALEFGAGLNSRHGLTLVIWAVVGLTLGLAVGFIAAGTSPASPRSGNWPDAGIPRSASCRSSKMPANATSCALSDRSTSSATLASRTASPTQHAHQPGPDSCGANSGWRPGLEAACEEQWSARWRRGHGPATGRWPRQCARNHCSTASCRRLTAAKQYAAQATTARSSLADDAHAGIGTP